MLLQSAWKFIGRVLPASEQSRQIILTRERCLCDPDAAADEPPSSTALPPRPPPQPRQCSHPLTQHHAPTSRTPPRPPSRRRRPPAAPSAPAAPPRRCCRAAYCELFCCRHGLPNVDARKRAQAHSVTQWCLECCLTRTRAPNAQDGLRATRGDGPRTAFRLPIGMAADPDCRRKFEHVRSFPEEIMPAQCGSLTHTARSVAARPTKATTPPNGTRRSCQHASSGRPPTREQLSA